MSTVRPSAADHPAAVFYRRALIDLDRMRVQLFAVGGGAPEVFAALANYRAAVQVALHEMGVRS